ncbi:MAG: 4Fe-4S dicluster domain-containing protein [Alphaproteobacteria bacterium]|uniref:4Fe-4S dicluster domain-containing protein n=1 Tax=Candidatus Nitrobium versatile TaxID=2884831 RepID=A0A953M2F2_9BACT|nr:4Fe-4S dicluster domain-containing protein [Candidatus Nitrobium versatile]
MQWAWYYDQTRCIGCNTCVVACKDWNDVKPGPAKWRRLTVKETGAFPNVGVFNLVMGCNHCENPACVAACPVGAVMKREEDGIVVVNREKCQGWKACLARCPFETPQFGDAESEPVRQKNWLVDHPMQKCHFCWDRKKEGKKPACVDSCPNRALDAGPMEDLMRKYPDAVRVVQGFPDSARDRSGNLLTSGATRPSILFKPKPPQKPEVL